MKKIIVIILLLFCIGTASCTNVKPENENDNQDNQNKTYEIVSEDIIIGEGTKWELFGMLTLPKDIEGKVPAIVLVHGSGGSDMDEAAHAYKPFKDIAEYLTSQGIAVIRYDKRTFTHGAKMAENYMELTIKDESVDDAILAANLLKNDSRINHDKVFLLGHSLGGMIAPRIDAEGGNFAGIIIFAGSPRLFSEIWYDQVIIELETLPDDQKDAGKEQIEEALKVFNSFKDMTGENAKKYVLLGASGYYWKDLDAYPSNEYLKNIEKPVLIMQGEKDFQVFADKDYAQYQTLLQGKDNVTFKLYPNLNHYFITSTTGTIDEYRIRNTVNTEVLQDIADWIKAN